MDKKSLSKLCLDLIEIDQDKPEAANEIAKALTALSTKVDSYAHVDKFAESQIEMLKKEKQHIDKQIKAYERVQETLRVVALNAMRLIGESKIKSDSGHGLSIRKTQIVKITNGQNLPDWAVETIVERVPNKTKIKEAIKSGEKVDGAELIENDYVVIK